MSPIKTDREKILNGMVWTMIEKLSAQGTSFVVSVILARLLTPAEYGVIALMNVFIVIASVFVVAGLNTSLIQKKDADELDFSTIYYCTLTMSIVVYGIVFFAAPFIAKIYEMPELLLLIRVFAISLLVQSYQSVQQAYVARHMKFKLNFMSTLISIIISGIVGVTMAFLEYGVWALVAQHLTAIIVSTFVLRYLVEWRPKLIFSWERAKSLINYGSKILGTTLSNTIYKEIRQLLIGLYYKPIDLALYNRGAQIPHLVTNNLDNTIRTVLFPAMANHSDDIIKVKQMLRRTIMTTSYVTYFCLTLLAVVSEPLIRVLLTDKWIDCVPYMQILCFSFMIETISVSYLQALKAIGKSNEVLKLDIYKKPVYILILFVALPFGVKAIAYSSLVATIYGLIINIFPTKKFFNYAVKEQLKDLSLGFALAIIMGIITWPFSLLPINDYFILIIQVIVAVLSYFSISKLFKMESYMYCVSLVKNIINKRKK